MTARVRIFALHCGGDLSDMATFDPFDEHVGTKVYNPYFMYVITHPERNGAVRQRRSSRDADRPGVAARRGRGVIPGPDDRR